MSIEVGKKAPDFKLFDTQEREVSLDDFRGSKVVLFFYPKANTSGWANEVTAFRDAEGEINSLGAKILGISKDSIKKQKNFKEKYELPFELLSDEDEKICNAYGVIKEKSMYGKKYMGIERTTFIIDEEGLIKKVFEKVKVAGHEKQVIEALKE